MSKAVFVDRDGVLNEAVVRDGRPHSPASLGEFAIIPGTAEALASLKEAGYLLIVTTNQPEVARGIQVQSVIEGMHAELLRSLPLDDIRVCYHDDRHHCACRKPEPGLIIDAARDWGIRLQDSFMIGDRWKDIEAGRRAGCTTVLLKRPYDQGEPSRADYHGSSLGDAAGWILGRAESGPVK